MLPDFEFLFEKRHFEKIEIGVFKKFSEFLKKFFQLFFFEKSRTLLKHSFYFLKCLFLIIN